MPSYDGAPTIRSSTPSPLTSPAGAARHPKSLPALSPVIVTSAGGVLCACRGESKNRFHIRPDTHKTNATFPISQWGSALDADWSRALENIGEFEHWDLEPVSLPAAKAFRAVAPQSSGERTSFNSASQF